MSTALYIIAVLLALVGLVGSVVPVLPGPTLSWIGWLLLLFIPDESATLASVVVWGVVLVVVSLLDNFGSTWLTGRMGGSKWGTRGCFVGMLIGMFCFPPLGLIVGPFVGAFVGELIGNATAGRALRVAFISFVAFLLTTGLKLIYSGLLLFFIARAAIQRGVEVVTLHFNFFEPTFAVMVAVPFFFAVIFPFFTVATAFLLVFHVTFFLVPFTFRVTVCPLISVTFVFDSFGAAIAAAENPVTAIRNVSRNTARYLRCFFQIFSINSPLSKDKAPK